MLSQSSLSHLLYDLQVALAPLLFSAWHTHVVNCSTMMSNLKLDGLDVPTTEAKAGRLFGISAPTQKLPPSFYATEGGYYRKPTLFVCINTRNILYPPTPFFKSGIKNQNFQSSNPENTKFHFWVSFTSQES